MKIFTGTRYIDDPLPNSVYTAIWMPTLAIMCTLGNTFGLLSGPFFLLSVWSP